MKDYEKWRINDKLTGKIKNTSIMGLKNIIQTITTDKI